MASDHRTQPELETRLPVLKYIADLVSVQAFQCEAVFRPSRKQN